MEKLKNKVALITGGTSGMGFATAVEFINQGAKVLITGRSQKNLDEALEKLGPDASGFISDAAVYADVFNLPDNIRKFFPSIDILFVNAGYGKFAPVEMVEEAQFDELFNLLAKGTFFTVQRTLPLINPGGSILLNTSVVTHSAFPNLSVYTAAKAAVQSFIKSFAAECTPREIRVNGISPGYIKTGIFQKTGLTQDQIKEAIQAITPTIPMKRFGEASEIAKAAVFLACADSSYIHGAEILVDGGLTAINS